MRPTFAGFELARRAMMAQRTGIDVTGHNIANANSPGYSRQGVVLAATPGYPAPTLDRTVMAGQIGTGVSVAAITRAHDAFVQAQLQTQAHASGYWSSRSDILDKVELTLLETGETGIRSSLDQFWQSLQELAESPESLGVRAVVRQRALSVTETFRHVAQALEPLRRDLDRGVVERVREINILATQISDLNEQIAAVTGVGDNPNDLYDQRDMLIERLARLADIQVVGRHQGMVAVTLNGVALVEGVQVRQIVAEAGEGGFTQLRWQGTNAGVQVNSGELAALLEGRDTIVPGYLASVDALAANFVYQINRIHQEGYDLLGNPGGALFVGNSAANIDVAPDIKEGNSGLNRIAASLHGQEGQGGNALRLADLRHARFMQSGTATMGDFIGSVVAELGGLAQKAQRMAENQEVVEGHLRMLRESISGVSPDEELIKLVQYQHAYGAAARVLNVMDEVIDIVINRMGIVGR